ncbi:MAG: pilus assembly protein N-terminal domain-containing protein [Myxococcaceae bacterium]|nr:pilus assembly protein N-terminal domain-containing protein [Myxococcaceae bacterium]
MHATVLWAAISLTALPAEGTIQLAPGTGDTLQQKGIVRVAVANPDVVEVQSPGPDELLFTGRQPGRTTITLWFKGGRTITRTVVVRDDSPSDLERMIHETVNPVLEVKQVGEKTIVDGTLDSMEELDRLEKLIGDDPDVVILARMNPAALPVLARRITEALHQNGLPNARAVAVGGQILLEGSVADEAERQKAQLIAEAFYAGWQGSAP